MVRYITAYNILLDRKKELHSSFTRRTNPQLQGEENQPQRKFQDESNCSISATYLRYGGTTVVNSNFIMH